MKQKVGTFGDQMVAVVAHRGDHRFHRFLTEFFGAVFRPLVEELSGVGRLSARCRAGIDNFGKVMDPSACLTACPSAIPTSSVVW